VCFVQLFKYAFKFICSFLCYFTKMFYQLMPWFPFFIFTFVHILSLSILDINAQFYLFLGLILFSCCFIRNGACHFFIIPRLSQCAMSTFACVCLVKVIKSCIIFTLILYSVVTSENELCDICASLGSTVIKSGP